ncbi:actin nucleation-promoting factor WAS-like [Daphnia carinata]|uniref:actin nucleation-promoting factor WAS-like n=1 Tax=Daphnia carinata TaxID=120202 RepID=UPI0025800F2A|nr:actin nucleation-promoting factor WAS-like [Daphnia carinata]
MPIRFRSQRNYSSRLLSSDEAAQLDQLIGTRCHSALTTVVQIFCPEPPEYTQWMKKDCGILCLITDKTDNQNHWLKIYCLVRREVIWQHKLHGDLGYRAPTPYFHTITTSDNTQIGLNFADEAEAAVFLKTARAYLVRNKALTRSGLSKEDISSPTNFRLISRIGWDRRRGIVLYNVDNELLHTFLSGFCNRSQLQKDNRQRAQNSSFKRRTITKSDISLPIDAKVNKRK